MYNGGKNNAGVYQSIINCFPIHDIYLELFVGSGAIYHYKAPADISILMDMVQLCDLPLKDRIRPGDLFINNDALIFLDIAGSILNYLVTAGNKILIYLDPPYLLYTRSCQKKMYNFEMSVNDHISLLSHIIKLKCMVAISSYDNKLYNDYLHDWFKVPYKVITRSGIKSEILYLNYEIPYLLHDYSYIGGNFKEREKFKLIHDNMLSKINRLPAALKNKIVNSILNYG